MRAILLIQFLLIYSSIIAKDMDTVRFSIEMSKYQEVAKKRFAESYPQMYYTGACASYPLSDKYKMEEVQTISVPVFFLNTHAKDYKCGDNLESLIEFKEDPYSQIVIITKKTRKIADLYVLDSYHNKTRIRDSMRGDPHIGPNPIRPRDEKTDKWIAYYMKKNPDSFVFVIAELYGYWAIRNGRLYKLKGLREDSANECFGYYGEEYIRDIAGEGMRIDHAYKTCCGDVKEITFNKMVIQMEKR